MARARARGRHRRRTEAARQRRALGALLSGGIDSSVIVALLAQLGHGPVRTFTVGFRAPRYDERAFARLVADRYSTVHEEVLVEPNATQLLPRLAWAFDQPLGDASALPTFLICEHARGQITVALTGDGGDEAFAGYERYVAHQSAEWVGRLPALLPEGAARLLRALPAGRQEPRSSVFRAARFLELASTRSTERYGRLMEVFPAALRQRLWTDEALAKIGRPRSTGELLGPPAAAGVTGLQLLDVATYLPGDLLLKADIASMANSLELRAAFLDHEVLEVAISLPDSLKTRGRQGKVALRQAFAADLPRQVAGRRKQGFGVPLAAWFRSELRELAGDPLLDRRARERGLFRAGEVKRLITEHAYGHADHSHRLWSLVMLELWQRFYVESERPPAPSLHPAVSRQAR